MPSPCDMRHPASQGHEELHMPSPCDMRHLNISGSPGAVVPFSAICVIFQLTDRHEELHMPLRGVTDVTNGKVKDNDRVQLNSAKDDAIADPASQHATASWHSCTGIHGLQFSWQSAAHHHMHDITCFVMYRSKHDMIASSSWSSSVEANSAWICSAHIWAASSRTTG
jgi:hypothetical protein